MLLIGVVDIEINRHFLLTVGKAKDVSDLRNFIFDKKPHVFVLNRRS